MVVLKGIPSVLSPELLYALAKMGHGDELGTILTKLIYLVQCSHRASLCEKRHRNASKL